MLVSQVVDWLNDVLDQDGDIQVLIEISGAQPVPVTKLVVDDRDALSKSSIGVAALDEDGPVDPVVVMRS